MLLSLSSPGSCTSVTHMKKLTFISKTAPGVGHTGGINKYVCSGTQHTQSTAALLTEDHLYQAVQTKSGVKAAVAVLSSCITLLTVGCMKIQNTG